MSVVPQPLDLTPTPDVAGQEVCLASSAEPVERLCHAMTEIQVCRQRVQECEHSGDAEGATRAGFDALEAYRCALDAEDDLHRAAHMASMAIRPLKDALCKDLTRVYVSMPAPRLHHVLTRLDDELTRARNVAPSTSAPPLDSSTSASLIGRRRKHAKTR